MTRFRKAALEIVAGKKGFEWVAVFCEEKSWLRGKGWFKPTFSTVYLKTIRSGRCKYINFAQTGLKVSQSEFPIVFSISNL
jgi:hypothetical protein